MRGILLALLLFFPVGGLAQQPNTAASPANNVRDNKPTVRRLYVGMWTLHFRDLDRGLESNQLLAVSWGRLYGATFVNSFGKRAYSGGVQETLARWSPRFLSLGLGYRVGLVTGYDERFIALAAKTPVLPMLQPLVNVDGKRVGLELSYSGVVTSAGLNVRW